MTDQNSKNYLGRKRFLSIGFLAGKIRRKGIFYCLDQVLRRLLGSAKVLFFGVIRPISFCKKQSCDAMLYAFYDLEVSPLTFDIFTFLVQAEIERIKKKCFGIRLVLVPAPNKSGAVYSDDERRWRLANIVTPSWRLMPSCKGVIVCDSREQAESILKNDAANIFPDIYSVRAPVTKHSLGHLIRLSNAGVRVPSIDPAEAAIRYVRKWIAAHSSRRKIVSITLRQCENQSERNSDIGEWAKFLKWLDHQKYQPVVLPDFGASFEALPDEFSKIDIFDQAVCNVELRAAFYQLCYVNLFVNNGPAVLCSLNDRTASVIFKMLVSDYDICSKDYFNTIGLKVGDQYPWSTPLQRIVWHSDELCVMQNEFVRMCQLIENSKDKQVLV